MQIEPAFLGVLLPWPGDRPGPTGTLDQRLDSFDQKFIFLFNL